MGSMESAVKDIEGALAFYGKDLDALSEEQVLGSAGGCARKPVDFTYETAEVNRRVAMRLRGETPPAGRDDDGWAVAPPELQSKAAVSEYLRASGEELLAAARAIPEAESGKLIGPDGHLRPAHNMASFAAMHIMYHDAQLNFIQSLAGDLEMHWF